MISLGELRVEAIRENLRTISYFLHGIARRLELTEETLFEIEVAVEEAAVNIVSHAYPPGLTGDILIHVGIIDDVLQITLADWGIPLDPGQVRPFDIGAPVEMRVEGGMGLHLIENLVDQVQRQVAPVAGQPNTLALTKTIKRLQPGAFRPSTTRELHAMRTVSEFMVSGRDLDELLRLIVNELVETIGAERGALFLVDEDNDELFSHVILEDTGVLGEIRVTMGDGISGHVAVTGEVLNIEDAYQDNRFLRRFDELTGFKTHAVLTAPLRIPQGKIVGVVQLLNKLGGAFTARDERLLTAMAAQAAISIENARLYEQEMRQRLLDQELETARMIQESFLPQTVPEHPGLDVVAYWRPISEVAGDFYDFYTLPDGRLAVVIADVSGKGVPAALFMALTVTVLRFAMSLNFPPAEVMHRANWSIISDQQSRMFATVFLGYLDLESFELQFASAGHNPPLLFRAETEECEYLATPGVAIGLFPEASYAGAKLTLGEGDVLVLYTDGITEIINANEEEFGEQRLEGLVVRNATSAARDLANLIVETAAAYATDDGILDDETLVVIKRLSS